MIRINTRKIVGGGLTFFEKWAKKKPREVSENGFTLKKVTVSNREKWSKKPGQIAHCEEWTGVYWKMMKKKVTNRRFQWVRYWKTGKKTVSNRYGQWVGALLKNDQKKPRQMPGVMGWFGLKCDQNLNRVKSQVTVVRLVFSGKSSKKRMKSEVAEAWPAFFEKWPTKKPCQIGRGDGWAELSWSGGTDNVGV